MDHPYVLICFVVVVVVSYLLILFKGKPRIVIPSQVTKTVPNFYVWCSSDGTPPIYMSLMNSSTILDEAVGRVKSRILIDGNYTCNASSEFGTDSKTFHVSVNGKIIALVCIEK